MTLHDILNAVPMLYWWYSAIPTIRTGRSHILRVPIVEIQPQENPRWRSIENGAIVIPNKINGNAAHYERACDSHQRAAWWARRLYMAPSNQRHRRGICDDCIQWQNEHGISNIGYTGEIHVDGAEEPLRFSLGYGLLHDSANNLEEWAENVRRAYTGP